MPDCRQIGEYFLLKELGRGGFGTVWEARHVSLGRISAVKVLDRLQADERQSRRFLREAQIAGDLHHPHIIKLLEMGRAQLNGSEVDFLVYDLIEGVTLGQWCRFTQLNFRETAELVAKLASAIHYAHQRGIVHRDLKPDNILVDLAGEPHIADFGLARKLDDRLTEENVTLGTVAYMSPEQARGESGEADPRSDVFSLGVVLFELITGELPYKGRSIPSYVAQISGARPTSPRTIAPAIPLDLETICLKCMAQEPEHRYNSAAALGDDLRSFVAGKPIDARPLGLLERLRRWAIREPVAATLVAVLLLTAIAGPIAALHQARLRSHLSDTATELRATNYGTDLFLAYQAWNEGRPSKTRKILDRSLPAAGEKDLRCFAWHFLDDRTKEAYRIVARSDLPIYDCISTSDRRRILTVGAAGSLDIWDLATGNRENSIPLSHESQFAVACMGDLILVGDRRNDVSVVDLYEFDSGTRSDSLVLDTSSTIESIRVAADESVFAVGTRYHGIHVFTPDGKQVGFFANHDRNENVRISPDNQYLAASFNHPDEKEYGLCVWDLKTNSQVAKRELPSKLVGLAWRPDSRHLAVQGLARQHVWLLSFPELKTVRDVPHGIPIARGLDFFDDGRTLVGGSVPGALFGQSLLFERPIYAANVYLPHEAEIHATRYMGQGELLSASADGTVVLSSPSEVGRQGASVLMTVGREARLAYSAARDSLIVGDAGGVLRDGHGTILRQFGQRICSLAFLGNDNRIACGLRDGSIVVMTVDDSAADFVLPSLGEHTVVRTVDALVHIPADDRLASGAADESLRLWSLKTKQMLHEFKVPDNVSSVVTGPEGSLVFASAAAEYISAYDVEAGREAYRLPCSTTYPLALHPHRPWLLSGHRDGGIAVWNLLTKEREQLLVGHTGTVRSLALSKDGNLLASSADDGALRFWDLARYREIGIAYQARPEWDLHSFAFLADGESLVGVLSQPNQKSLILRVGGRRQEFTGYNLRLSELDYHDGVTTQVLDRNGSQVIHCATSQENHGLIGAWLDERCKGREIRASVRFDLHSGQAKALIDHYGAKDRDASHEGAWHGISPQISAGTDLTLTTDWVRITAGDWHTGPPDVHLHPYGAILRLSAGAKADIHAFQIEARPLQ